MTSYFDLHEQTDQARTEYVHILVYSLEGCSIFLLSSMVVVRPILIVGQVHRCKINFSSFFQYDDVNVNLKFIQLNSYRCVLFMTPLLSVYAHFK